MVVKEELKLFWKCIKNVPGDQGGCERRIEVIVKMEKREKKSRGRAGFGGQGGCERRIEVIVKILGGFGGGGGPVGGRDPVGRGSGGGGPGQVGLEWGEGCWSGVGGRGLVGSKIVGRGWCGVCEPRIEGKQRAELTRPS